MKCSLLELLTGIKYRVIQGNADIQVSDICIDTRDMVSGSVYVCLSGAHTDSHDMVQQAVYKGAVAIVCEKPVNVTDGITVIMVRSTREAVSYMAMSYYNNPSSKMIMIGITGTKGKTTTAYMIERILNGAGIKTGLIGSIEIKYNDISRLNENTTPEPVKLQGILAEMYDNGIQAVVMEVSSQALKMCRVSGIIFDYGVFTNLSRDHIGKDEHQDMEEYIQCKSMLFEQSRHGIFNKDDKYSLIMKNSSIAGRISCFGIGNDSRGFDEVYMMTYADRVNLSLTDGTPGVMFAANVCRSGGDKLRHAFSLNLPGIFSVYNALAAVTVCDIILSDTQLQDRLGFMSGILSDFAVKGRLEVIPVDTDYSVIVDYAHNEISLELLLESMRKYVSGRLITVFGCGGNRSRERRFKMGEVSARLSDITVVTSDNPRYENPDDIMGDIEKGILKILKESDKIANDRVSFADGKYIMISDRQKAVETALNQAKKGDMVIVAGKGHETYQEIKGVRYRMLDSDIIKDWNNKNKWRT